MHKNNQSLNEKLIISATNYAREFLNIDEELWVFINDSKHFMGINHSALYDKENFIIRFNKDWLINATEDNILKTAFHEVFHVFQHTCLLEIELGYNRGIFTNNELEKMKHEFLDENYSTELGQYENLLIEQQAETFAHEFYKTFKSEFNNICGLIEKYNEKYINK